MPSEDTLLDRTGTAVRTHSTLVPLLPSHLLSTLPRCPVIHIVTLLE